VLEDVPDDARILDQHDDTHRALARRAPQRIGFVDLADEPDPGGRFDCCSCDVLWVPVILTVEFRIF
jgi:hypothetical protein